jgi:hypothetical protein
MAIPKRPRDPNQLAKSIVDISTGEIDDTVSDKMKAVDLKGRKGGKAGGPARAAKLTPEERAEIARIAASARWKKKD